MLTENEVRRSIEDISMSECSPMHKVREMLKVARTLKSQARSLLHARALSAQAEDLNTAAHMDRMLRSLRTLYEEVRLAADRIRCESPSEVVFDLALA